VLVNHDLASYGLWALFFLVAMESAGIPVPGETALIAAAVLASQGTMVLWEVLLVAALGAIVGDNIGYWIGRKGGRALLLRWKLTRGTAERLLPPGERFFRKHGPKTVFLARFIAGLRVVAAWIAGITHMRWRTFLVWNALGGITWAVGYGLLAYYFGKALVNAISTYGLYAAVVIAVLALAGFFGYRYWKHRRRASAKRVAKEEVVVVAPDGEDAGPTHDLG
jgi:membrane protein DedA with SNARE-associated domain